LDDDDQGRRDGDCDWHPDVVDNKDDDPNTAKLPGRRLWANLPINVVLSVGFMLVVARMVFHQS